MLNTVCRQYCAHLLNIIAIIFKCPLFQCADDEVLSLYVQNSVACILICSEVKMETEELNR